MAQFPSSSSAYGIWNLKDVRDAERGDNWPRVIVGFSLSDAVYDSVSFSVTSQSTVPTGITFNNDGTKMYIVDLDNNSVFQYSLSTAFDLSTASYDSVSDNLSAENTDLGDLVFNDDGTKMYSIDRSSSTVYQYSLSTAFNVSGATYDSASLSVGSQDAAPTDLKFNPDGTKLYVCGYGSDGVYQYSLSTAFNISSASYDSVYLAVGSQTNFATGISFNSDGTKLFLCGAGNNSAFQYSLTTAYDLSTASYDSVSFDLSSQDTSIQGIAFSNDGAKMYIVGATNDSVFQYSTEE